MIKEADDELTFIVCSARMQADWREGERKCATLIILVTPLTSQGHLWGSIDETRSEVFI